MSEKETILALIDTAVFLQEYKIREIDKDIEYWRAFQNNSLKKNRLQQWQRRKELAIARRDQCLKILRMIKDVTA